MHAESAFYLCEIDQNALHYIRDRAHARPATSVQQFALQNVAVKITQGAQSSGLCQKVVKETAETAFQMCQTMSM